MNPFWYDTCATKTKAPSHYPYRPSRTSGAADPGDDDILSICLHRKE